MTGQVFDRLTVIEQDLAMNGVDRIKNNLGYYSVNCVPCCKLCNLAKRDMSYSAFYEWAERLANNLLERSA